MSFVQYIKLLFSWMPDFLIFVAVVFLVLAAVILALRIVRFILDCIPFA